MNACNFVDYTSEGSHCESRMREICTYGLTRRRARPVRPSLLYCFKILCFKFRNVAKFRVPRPPRELPRTDILRREW